RHLHPADDRFPGLTHFGFVLDDVLVGAVHRQLQRAAGTAHGGLEARVGGDGVVGQDAPVAPPTDAEPVGVGDTFLDGPVHAGQQIDDLLVTPVGEDGLLVRGPAAVAAPVVHLQ